jgi:hypothetical protein
VTYILPVFNYGKTSVQIRTLALRESLPENTGRILPKVAS